jgi:ADP-ribose pyrophosphatase
VPPRDLSDAESVPWEVLETEYLLETPWRKLRRDRIRLHDDAETLYDYFEVPDAVFVVPLTTDGQMVLRQYRHPVRAWTTEIVGGAVDLEGCEASARRELREEIGGTCRELVALGEYYLSVASLTARGYAYLALDVELGAPEHEDMELIEITLLDPEEAFRLARTGGIDESQSALALLMAEPLVRAHLARRSADV